MMQKNVLRKIGIGVFILILFSLMASVPALYGDYLWFSSLEYESIFEKKILYQIGLFFIITLFTFILLYLNYRVVVRNINKAKPLSTNLISIFSILLVSIFVGSIYSSAWDTILLYINAENFGITDPAYSRDLAFYVFDLPLYRLLSGYFLLIVFLSLMVSLSFYTLYFGIEKYEEVLGERNRTSVDINFKILMQRIRQYSYIHISVIFGFLFLAIAGKFYIDRIELVFSPRGAVFGLAATDSAIFKPLLLFVALVSVIAGILNILNSRLKRDEIIYFSFISILLIATAGSFAGMIYQSYSVEPDEFNKEKEYIQREIEMTRSGFNLNRVDEREIELNPLTSDDVRENPQTIDNIRLWDHRPLRTVYNEIQSLRTYYNFPDLDSDRYNIGGKKRQIMVGTREIELDELPSRSQSWVNRHLVYTHGYGITMSPVRSISEEGMPKLYIKDMPLNYSFPENSSLNVEQPRIYYGKSTDTYAIVNSGTQELDYPSGDQNVYTSYKGKGGVELSSSFRKIIYSLKFSSPQIFLSESVTDQSKIQFKRQIKQRASEIAPFLEYEDEPYVVASNGQLYWILDAYTTSSNYPYSSPESFKGKRKNYIRNSVKVVTNAYTGETNFYIVDREPIIQAWSNTFPSLFKSFNAMPEEIKNHIRYPKDYFSVQIDSYTEYHMKDPQVFYNKEDKWKIPKEKLRGQSVEMEPYYVTMGLPGEDINQEFVLIMPFTPTGKQNMIGWLAARSDPPNYGEIIGFQFSKQELAFGPSQIESRIDQDTNISRQFTLWSQRGSDVFRGNLLAIPIESSILYVEPIYLEGTSEGAIPELKRVVVAQENNLTMQPTLNRGLNKIFGERVTEADVPENRTQLPDQIRRNLQEANNLYREANRALSNGNFELYAEKIESLGEVLNRTKTP